jgi:diadenosine tetraphosphatase ApaH/serine/threonine PP2A family protein phosphatase
MVYAISQACYNLCCLWRAWTTAAEFASIGHSRVFSRIQRIRRAILDPVPESTMTKLQLDAFESSVILRQLDRSSVYASDVGAELVEYRTYDARATPGEIKATRSLIRDFAAGLHESDPSTIGLLRCNGFSAEPVYNRFALRFQYPVGKTEPQTLEHLLTHASNQSPGIRHSLIDRIALVRKLASAVLYVPSCGFVHKNIRPANILIFGSIVPEGTDPAKMAFPNVIREPFLVGFDSVRKATAASSMIRV